MKKSVVKTVFKKTQGFILYKQYSGSLIYRVIWKKISSPFFEYITPTILDSNELEEITDYRTHQGMLENENPQNDDGEVRCSEVPSSFSIMTETVQVSSVKTPLDVSNHDQNLNKSIEDKTSLNKIQVHRTKDVDGQKMSLLYKFIMKRIVDPKIENLMPNLINEFSSSQFCDFRQHQENMNLKLERVKSTNDMHFGQTLDPLAPLDSSLMTEEKVNMRQLLNSSADSKNSAIQPENTSLPTDHIVLAKQKTVCYLEDVSEQPSKHVEKTEKAYKIKNNYNQIKINVVKTRKPFSNGKLNSKYLEIINEKSDISTRRKSHNTESVLVQKIRPNPLTRNRRKKDKLKVLDKINYPNLTVSYPKTRVYNSNRGGKILRKFCELDSANKQKVEETLQANGSEDNFQKKECSAKSSKKVVRSGENSHTMLNDLENTKEFESRNNDVFYKQDDTENLPHSKMSPSIPQNKINAQFSESIDSKVLNLTGAKNKAQTVKSTHKSRSVLKPLKSFKNPTKSLKETLSFAKEGPTIKTEKYNRLEVEKNEKSINGCKSVQDKDNNVSLEVTNPSLVSPLRSKLGIVKTNLKDEKCLRSKSAKKEGENTKQLANKVKTLEHPEMIKTKFITFDATNEDAGGLVIHDQCLGQGTKSELIDLVSVVKKENSPRAVNIDEKELLHKQPTQLKPRNVKNVEDENKIKLRKEDASRKVFESEAMTYNGRRCKTSVIKPWKRTRDEPTHTESSQSRIIITEDNDSAKCLSNNEKPCAVSLGKTDNLNVGQVSSGFHTSREEKKTDKESQSYNFTAGLKATRTFVKTGVNIDTSENDLVKVNNTALLNEEIKHSLNYDKNLNKNFNSDEKSIKTLNQEEVDSIVDKMDEKNTFKDVTSKREMLLMSKDELQHGNKTSISNTRNKNKLSKLLFSKNVRSRKILNKRFDTTFLKHSKLSNKSRILVRSNKNDGTETDGKCNLVEGKTKNAEAVKHILLPTNSSKNLVLSPKLGIPTEILTQPLQKPLTNQPMTHPKLLNTSNANVGKDGETEVTEEEQKVNEVFKKTTKNKDFSSGNHGPHKPTSIPLMGSRTSSNIEMLKGEGTAKKESKKLIGLNEATSEKEGNSAKTNQMFADKYAVKNLKVHRVLPTIKLSDTTKESPIKQCNEIVVKKYTKNSPNQSIYSKSATNKTEKNKSPNKNPLEHELNSLNNIKKDDVKTGHNLNKVNYKQTKNKSQLTITKGENLKNENKIIRSKSQDIVSKQNTLVKPTISKSQESLTGNDTKKTEINLTKTTTEANAKRAYNSAPLVHTDKQPISVQPTSNIGLPKSTKSYEKLKKMHEKFAQTQSETRVINSKKNVSSSKLNLQKNQFETRTGNKLKKELSSKQKHNVAHK